MLVSPTVKFLKNTTKSGSEYVSFHKKYRNKLNQLIPSAERKHFYDVLLEHKSSWKKVLASDQSSNKQKEIYSC